MLYDKQQTLHKSVARHGGKLCSFGKHAYVAVDTCVNSLSPRQNGRHFPDTFSCISLNETF